MVDDRREPSAAAIELVASGMVHLDSDSVAFDDDILYVDLDIVEHAVRRHSDAMVDNDIVDYLKRIDVHCVRTLL